MDGSNVMGPAQLGVGPGLTPRLVLLNSPVLMAYRFRVDKRKVRDELLFQLSGPYPER